MNELEKERKKQLEEQHKIAFYHGIAERKKIQGLNNRINNLQSKIDKTIELLEHFKSDSQIVENEWAISICEVVIKNLKEVR